MRMMLLLLFAFLGFYQTCFGMLYSVLWKGSYYNGIPNESHISPKYCQEHTPGTFIHSVKETLDNGVKTDKNIKLDHGSFREEKKQGLFFITGELLSHGKTGNHEWEDHIHYYLYKLTEYGATQGIWTTGKCKGLYMGALVK